MSDASTVAAWMLAELQRDGTLYQEHAVREIAAKFGSAFTYENENGNPAICPRVLAAFRKLAVDATWNRAERMWEMTTDVGMPGRHQPVGKVSHAEDSR